MTGVWLTFDVPGIPAPKGSKTYSRTKTGKVVGYESSQALPDWMTVLHTHATQAVQAAKWVTATGPVAVNLRFRLLRPKSVKRRLPTVKPDNDKLERAVYDALKIARVFQDDALITDNTTVKRYAEPGQPPGVFVMVMALEKR